MNSKRRAELQRKLSMSAVPRPPAGLSDRIKGDIPQYLAAEPERTRFAGSVAFSMRVAASILLLITTAFVTLRLLEPKHQPAMMAARNADQVMPAMTRYSEGPAAKAAAPQAPASEEVRLDIAQEMPVPPAALRAAPAAPRQMVDLRAEEDAPARRDAARNEAHDRAVDGEAAGSAGDFIVDAMQETTITAAAPAPAPQAAEAPASAPAGDQPERAKRAATPSLVSEAYASGLALGPKSEVFGISVDPHSFLDIKSAIENGARPPAGMVNVDALVNYFAGAPVHPPRRGASLEVEASPGPAQADGDQALLRFSVDTPKVTLAERSSTPPAAQDARLEIEIDDDAVASFRRIGGSTTMPPESTLLHNVSVTGLYQLELRPHLKASQHVATVRLRYRSVTDGKEQVITRVIRGRDLAKDWARASRRHRLASLGAVWSESLKTAVAGNEGVAKRAEELALQKPGDARARELANAVNATAGGGR